MPQYVTPTFEEAKAMLNRPLNGHGAAVEDARRLRSAQDRLAAARARLEKAALEAYAQRKTGEALKAELLASVQAHNNQGRRVAR